MIENRHDYVNGKVENEFDVVNDTGRIRNEGCRT